jgi:hypothetical protein
VARRVSTTAADIREAPSYRIAEAAHYLGMPLATLRAWVLGQPYQTPSGRRLFAPPIGIAQRQPPLLSFLNLVEVHVLDAIRREHHVSLQKVRKALQFLRERFPSPHPLADQRFMTDGLDLFISRYGQLINISQAGRISAGLSGMQPVSRSSYIPSRADTSPTSRSALSSTPPWRLAGPRWRARALRRP